MKRVKAACILQTLVFSQKEDLGLTHSEILERNQQEVLRYRQSLSRTRHQIDSEETLADGSIVLCVRKQYSDRTDVGTYFQA